MSVSQVLIGHHVSSTVQIHRAEEAGSGRSSSSGSGQEKAEEEEKGRSATNLCCRACDNRGQRSPGEEGFDTSCRIWETAKYERGKQKGSVANDGRSSGDYFGCTITYRNPIRNRRAHSFHSWRYPDTRRG